MQGNKLNIALVGYGKMGKIIEEFAINRGHAISLRSNSKTPLSEKKEGLDGTDVAIEFSTPDAAVENLEILAAAGVPTVCGTTGWLKKYDHIERQFRANSCPFLYASNFSVGVNILFSLNKRLAEIMDKFSDYEVRMSESHHKTKLDAPSGTAVSLADQIIDVIDRLKSWHKGEEPRRDSIPITSYREGDVKGMHEIVYRSPIDEIVIRHEAFSRNGFALGAILAAEFIYNKEGIYDMEDVLRI